MGRKRRRRSGARGRADQPRAEHRTPPAGSDADASAPAEPSGSAAQGVTGETEDLRPDPAGPAGAPADAARSSDQEPHERLMNTRFVAALRTPDEVPANSAARLHLWQIQAVRDVLFVAALLGLLYLGYAIRAVTVPLLIALLLAYLFEPLIIRLCRHPRITRVRAISGLLTAGGLLVAILIAVIAPLAVSQVSRLYHDLRSGQTAYQAVKLGEHVPRIFEDDYERLVEGVLGEATVTQARRRVAIEHDRSGTLDPDVAGPPAPPPGLPAGPEGGDLVTRAEVERMVQDAVERRADAPSDRGAVMRRWAGVGASIAGTVIGFGIAMFLIPFYFFFFSLWYPDVVAFFRKLIPRRNRGRTLDLLHKMDNVVAGFVRGRIVISAIMGVMLAVGWFACGVPYSIPLGVIVGVFCAVPYLGGVGIPAAIGLLYFDQFRFPVDERLAWYWVILLPSGVFAIVQIIEGYVLTPIIAGRATNLDPVTILVAVLAGGSLLGVYGMLIAIPLAACLKILTVEVVLPRVSAWTRGDVADPLPIDRS